MTSGDVGVEVQAARPEFDGAALSPGLKADSLGLASSCMIAVASTAPAYSFAATVGLLAAAVGFASPGILWLAFVPMFLIAVAYRAMNRVDPECGTSFTWVKSTAGPHLAWMTGWVMVVADVFVVASLAQVAGLYTFLLADPAARPSTAAVTAVGVGWIVVMTAIAAVGIEVSARTQWVLVSVEVAILAVFVVAALVQVVQGTLPGATLPELSWFSPLSGPGNVGDGLLFAVFMYWGWDTAVSVNEETRAPSETPGRAALFGTVGLLVLYVAVTTAALSVAGAGALSAHPDDALSFLGTGVLGDRADSLLILAVLLSAAASTQTTILPTARTLLSMGRRAAVPRALARVHPRYATPVVATVVTGAASVVWYVGLTVVSEDVLADSIAALGLMIAYYYGVTGVVCVVRHRHRAFGGVKAFVVLALAPAAGAAALACVFVAACVDLANPANAASGTEWLGVGAPLVIAGAVVLIGIVSMSVWRLHDPSFFRGR